MYMKTFKNIGLRSYFIYNFEPYIRIFQVLDNDSKTLLCKDVDTNNVMCFTIQYYKNVKFETYKTLEEIKEKYIEDFI